MSEDFVPIEPSEQLAARLREFCAATGAVDHFFFPVADPPPDESVHRQVAVTTVRLLHATADLPPEDELGYRPCTAGWRFEIDERRAQSLRGEPIDYGTFMGDWYDAQRDVLLFPGVNDEGRSTLVSAAVPPPTGSYSVLTGRFGYAYAFSFPPYKLTDRFRRALPRPRIAELFDAIRRESFDRDTSQIYAWPTDWTGYFRPGLEWWGAGLWTVYTPGRPMVGIASSATD